MGKIAEDMERLCREIGQLRRERRTFVRNLRTDVVQLRERFQKEHSEMARQSRLERAEIVGELEAARRAWSRLADPMVDEQPEDPPAGSAGPDQRAGGGTGKRTTGGKRGPSR